MVEVRESDVVAAQDLVREWARNHRSEVRLALKPEATLIEAIARALAECRREPVSS